MINQIDVKGFLPKSEAVKAYRGEQQNIEGYHKRLNLSNYIKYVGESEDEKSTYSEKSVGQKIFETVI